uniref:Cysteine and tyrosine-rich protein 1 n=1 Tax=Xenopus tropicalis TaxID=8364 RepID=A0A803JDV8_XENTR
GRLTDLPYEYRTKRGLLTAPTSFCLRYTHAQCTEYLGRGTPRYSCLTFYSYDATALSISAMGGPVMFIKEIMSAVYGKIIDVTTVSISAMGSPVIVIKTAIISVINGYPASAPKPGSYAFNMDFQIILPLPITPTWKFSGFPSPGPYP